MPIPFVFSFMKGMKGWLCTLNFDGTGWWKKPVVLHFGGEEDILRKVDANKS